MLLQKLNRYKSNSQISPKSKPLKKRNRRIERIIICAIENTQDLIGEKALTGQQRCFNPYTNMETLYHSKLDD